MRHTLIPIVTSSVLALTGCAATTSPTTDSPAEPAPATASTPAGVCPNPHGGSCLGDLEAGTYATSEFDPGIVYTVPDGWTNQEDLPGNFLLHRRDDPQSGVVGGSYLGIYQGVRAAAINCEEASQPNVGSTPADLVAWYQSIPGLTTAEPVAVTVGGLEGLQLDLGVKEGAAPCNFDGVDAVPIIIGNGVSELHHVALPGLEMRLILLDWEGTNLTIEITNVNEQHTADECRAETQPLIDSLTFKVES